MIYSEKDYSFDYDKKSFHCTENSNKNKNNLLLTI